MATNLINENELQNRTPTITLIGKKQAKIGHRFIFMGPVPECRECPLKNICFNLEKGRRYQILKVREKEHKCTLFDERVRVVEVEQVPFIAGIPRNQAFEGSIITFRPQGCGRRGCNNWFITHPVAVENSSRIKIMKILRDIECPDGSNFKEALVDFED